MPIPLHSNIVAVTSLQLVGPRLSEAQLLNAGRLVENAVKNEGGEPARAVKSAGQAVPNLR
jgi:Asp-tRNA(Asn)/Glu-tRNA(Gln) amidotransferase A subunit family amidase